MFKEGVETVDLVETEFEQFVLEAEPVLRRGYLGTVGMDRMPDALRACQGLNALPSGSPTGAAGRTTR